MYLKMLSKDCNSISPGPEISAARICFKSFYGIILAVNEKGLSYKVGR